MPARERDTQKPRAVEQEASTEPRTGPQDTLTAKDVVDRYEQGLKATRSHHFNYWMNDAYVLGDQWLSHNQHTNQIEQVPVDEDRVQVTVNHMWPASRTIISKAVQRPLQFYVPPTGADDATIRGARTAESILVNLHREHDWEGVREDAHWAAWKGGTSAIRIVWDSQAGTPLGMDEESGQHFATGDTCEDVLNITDFVVEPGARNAETARWWIVCVGLPPKQVQEMFGLAKEPPADGAAATTPFHKSVAGLEGQQSTGTAEIPRTKVFTLYQRPTPDMPKGLVVSVVDNAVVDSKPWPFPFKDRLNFVTIRETRKEGTWLGETVLKSARPIQNAINASWSAIIEHLKLAGNARLMVPQSMIETLNELTDRAAEVLPFPDMDSGNNRPDYLTPPRMPAWWVDAPEKFKQEMDDLLGVHEVSRGDAPGRVDSGLAISILVEQDSSPVGRFVKESAGAFGRLATMALMLYEANVKETRVAVVKEPGQPARKHEWTGKNLKGQTSAEVPLDSITPRSKAADEALATKMMEMGAISTPEEWFKVANVPMDRDILEAVSPDVAKARRENASMALGEVSIPEKFDDHVKHIAEHHVYMKSADWDTLSKKEQDVFKLHCQAHETLAAEEIGRQRAKGNVDPALMASADANGAPLLPMGDIPPGGPASGPPPVGPPPGPEPDGDEAGAVSVPSSIDPVTASLIQSGQAGALQ